jgi:hypothetical protein
MPPSARDRANVPASRSRASPFRHDELVTSDRFSDRLDPDSFADDPVVGVFESDASEADALWISERLFGRLVHFAQAYELHTLPQLGGTDPVRLGQAQCQSLLDELAFVADRLNDPLAISTAQSISSYVLRRAHRPGAETFVTFEGE